jgi:hypothetical protein
MARSGRRAKGFVLETSRGEGFFLGDVNEGNEGALSALTVLFARIK